MNLMNQEDIYKSDCIYFILVQKAFFVAGNGLIDITLGAKLFVLKVAPVW